MYSRIYVLRFPRDIVDQPIISQLVRQFDMEFNILQATIMPHDEGVMILQLRGHKTNINKALGYLKEVGVIANNLATGIRRDDDKCFQCGACTGVCPTEALALRRKDMAVLFDPEKCSGCSRCVPVCPVRAMAVSIEQSDSWPAAV